MNVYKINDIISCEFLKIPKLLFADPKYKSLSSDAKLTYALLYDRLSLSKLNAWINDKDEVYLIYTREEVADDLGITYKKAIAAFKELAKGNLITEKRCGRGMPNRIYIVKPELNADGAKKYVKHENLRAADSLCLEAQLSKEEPETLLTTTGGVYIPDVPISEVKICQNSTSRTAETEVSELPDSHSNKTYNTKNYKNQTDKSQSVRYGARGNPYYTDGQADGIYSLDDILENCQLDTFDQEERKILYDALERLFYSESLRIGNAVLPREKVRSRMYEIDAVTLQSALSKLHKNEKPIKNMTAYVMSTIFNCITEDCTLLHVDPYLNLLRRDREE